jgi:hypothetical protein
LKINTLVRATHLGRIERYLAQVLCQKKPESAQAGRPYPEFSSVRVLEKHVLCLFLHEPVKMNEQLA